MKKVIVPLFLLLIAACLFVIPCSAKSKAKHVVLIGLDGWGAYSVPKADIPHIKQLMAEGSYTLEKRSVLPSSSAVNWASMFMGAGPELHGYTEWGSKTPELPSRILNEHGIFPTIFRHIPKRYAAWPRTILRRNNRRCLPFVSIIRIMWGIRQVMIRPNIMPS